MLLICFLPGCSTAKPPLQTGKPDTLVGGFEILPHFKRPQLNREITVIVYLPPGYKNQDGKSYPVLYLTDGKNLFNNRTAYKNERKVDETIQSLVE